MTNIGTAPAEAGTSDVRPAEHTVQPGGRCDREHTYRVIGFTDNDGHPSTVGLVKYGGGDADRAAEEFAIDPDERVVGAWHLSPTVTVPWTSAAEQDVHVVGAWLLSPTVTACAVERDRVMAVGRGLAEAAAATSTAGHGDGYPRLVAGPGGYGFDTIWLERHLGDSQPQPLFSRCYIDNDDDADVLWSRLVAGLPRTVAKYQAVTVAAGVGFGVHADQALTVAGDAATPADEHADGAPC